MRIKPAMLFICTILSLYINAQSTSTRDWTDSARLRPRVNGDIKQLLRWTDRSGDNYLVLTETPAVKSERNCGDNCTDKELYAYHFGRKDSLVWLLNDFQKGCSLNNLVGFRKGAARITDLDKNGLAEIWIMYSLACINDAVPRTLKLIMYQGNNKYAIRGTSQPSKTSNNSLAGKIYIPGKEFQTLLPVFREFAEKYWNEHLYDSPEP